MLEFRYSINLLWKCLYRVGSRFSGQGLEGLELVEFNIFFATFPNSTLISATDGAARISYHLIPRHRESNPRHVESSRVAPDWDISDALPTELQRRGWLSEKHECRTRFYSRNVPTEVVHHKFSNCHLFSSRTSWNRKRLFFVFEA